MNRLVRVVLHDGRVASPTHQEFDEFGFDETTPALLRIPPGVWHADQNTGDVDPVILNFPTRAYDAADPDKHRIDPHSDEIPSIGRCATLSASGRLAQYQAESGSRGGSRRSPASAKQVRIGCDRAPRACRRAPASGRHRRGHPLQRLSGLCAHQVDRPRLDQPRAQREAHEHVVGRDLPALRVADGQPAAPGAIFANRSAFFASGSA